MADPLDASPQECSSFSSEAMPLQFVVVEKERNKIMQIIPLLVAFTRLEDKYFSFSL